MGKIIKKRIEYGGSSNSAENIKYDDTKNVKEAINEVKSEIATTNSNLTASDNTTFRFGVNENGEYGYIVTDSEGADTVIPFKSGGGDATTLYQALQYSGLVTSDMTFDEMCAVLSENFPQYIYFVQSGVRNTNMLNAFSNGSVTYLSVTYTDSNSTFRLASTYALSGQSYISTSYVTLTNTAKFDIINKTKMYITINGKQVRGSNSTGYYLSGVYFDILNSSGEQIGRAGIANAGRDTWLVNNYTIDLTGINEKNCYFRFMGSAVTSGNTNYYQIIDLYME